MKTILFKPFEKYSENTLLIVGVFLTIFGSFLGFFFDARFDGVLDLHFSKNVQFQDPFIDNLINIFSLFIFLFFLAKYLNRKTRSVDILITAMIARTPLYLFSLVNSSGRMSSISAQFVSARNPKGTALQNIDLQKITEVVMENGFFLAIVSLLSILCLVWYIALLYNGFKTASHAKGAKPIILFFVALVAAEILSKFLLYQLNNFNS